MPSLTIKNIDPELYGRLKKQASEQRRSLNSEVIVCLKRSLLMYPMPGPEELIAESRAVREMTKDYVITNDEMDQAQQIAFSAEKRMLNRERWPASSRILELVQSSGCSAYDCEFISLALDLPLVTLDKNSMKQFPSITVSPKAFSGK